MVGDACSSRDVSRSLGNSCVRECGPLAAEATSKESAHEEAASTATQSQPALHAIALTPIWSGLGSSLQHTRWWMWGHCLEQPAEACAGYA